MAEREPVFYRAAEAAGFTSFPGTVALEDWDRVGEALLGLLAREREARERALDALERVPTLPLDLAWGSWWNQHAAPVLRAAGRLDG